MGVQLLYNVVLVSTVQQSESAIHTHISQHFWISLIFRSSHSIEEFPELHSRFSLLICLYIVSIVYICQSKSPSTPQPAFRHLDVHTFVLYVCVFISALQIRSFIPFFQIPHIRVNIQYLLFSFWLTSLCMTVSRSIQVSTNDPISFIFVPE